VDAGFFRRKYQRGVRKIAGKIPVFSNQTSKFRYIVLFNGLQAEAPPHHPVKKIELGIYAKIQHVGYFGQNRQGTYQAAGEKIPEKSFDSVVVVVAPVKQGDKGAGINQDGV
jgi:hypothetical protein